MELKPEKISEVIRSQIKNYQNAIIQNETGTVLTVGDGIARVSGLYCRRRHCHGIRPPFLHGQ